MTSLFENQPLCPFLPKASFGLWVSTLPMYVCVRLSVCQSWACPHNNSWPVQARITKFGLKVQNTLVKALTVLAGNWSWSSRSNLTHWGRVTHICVSKLTIMGSDNGLPPYRRQAIIVTNAGILLIRTLGTNFSEILGEIRSISFKKMHLKMSSAKGRLFSLGLNELKSNFTWFWA